VIAIAAAGAIVGDNLGYWLIGRLGGRALFRRWRWLNRYSDRVLPRAESLMTRHGGKTVFFGRFVSILRYTVAWVAGLSRMRWWRFLFWNAAGGIAWATAVGLTSYYGGRVVADAIQRYGLYAGAAVVVALVVGWLGCATHAGESKNDSDAAARQRPDTTPCTSSSASRCGRSRRSFPGRGIRVAKEPKTTKHVAVAFWRKSDKML
jgi:membrane protein DedA with SNARE-associated domain